MAYLSFPGGIHPPEMKMLSESMPLETLPLPDTVSLFAAQNMGKPPSWTVQPGDTVKTGQPIATASGFVSVPLHAPVTGTVLPFSKAFHPVLQKSVEVCQIQREGEDDWQLMAPFPDWQNAPQPELVQRVLDAGIVGLGGATFPSHVKYSGLDKQPVDTVILNGAECEPYLTIDDQTMQKKAQSVVRGLAILMKITGASRGIIGVEANKLPAVEALRREATTGITVQILKTKYPQGGEKQLIYALTSRKVPAGGLPLHIGVVVHNVGTAVAIDEAVTQGKPLVERGVTVSGECVTKPKNLWVRIGTPVQQLLDYCGGFSEPPYKLLMGGPMMGIALKDATAPVMKGTSGILAVPKRGYEDEGESPCINCGACIHGCSLRLEPNVLVKLVKARKYDQAVERGLLYCCECGTCTFVCPSRIEHVKHFKLGKKVYNALKGGK